MSGKQSRISDESELSGSIQDSDLGVKQQVQQYNKQQPQQYRRKFSQINHEPENKPIITKHIPSVLTESDLKVKILDLKDIFAAKLASVWAKASKELVERNKHLNVQKSTLKTYSKPIGRRRHAPHHKLRIVSKMPRREQHQDRKRDKRKLAETNSVYESNEIRQVGPNGELIVITCKTSKTVTMNDQQQQQLQQQQQQQQQQLQQPKPRIVDNSLTVMKTKKDRAHPRSSLSHPGRRLISEMPSSSRINDKSVQHTKHNRIRLRKVKLNRQKTMPLSLYKAITNFLNDIRDQ